MLFNSLHFLIFFTIVTAAYFCLPERFRWLWLLLASVYFYMAFIPVYMLILAFTIVIDYAAGILIEKTRKKSYLVMSIIANLGVLFVFKYYNFFMGQFHLSPLSIILPIGLSFHTFQAMSYTIEVFRGFPAERHFGKYALYVMFFPQLVAGPIERPQNLLHQFSETHVFSVERLKHGLQLMSWGFFKKIVIADNLGLAVNPVFANPAHYSGFSLVGAAVFFTYQLYCDFSAYSDIARGSAHILGFRLMKNFDRPFAAASVAEFWKRWHISLSTWFRDYVYIPLGGSRVGKSRLFFNVMLVFLLSGLWHGANWTFIVWGAMHGAMVFFSRAVRVPAPRFLKQIATFGLVAVSMIFFRANTLADAWYMVTHLHTGGLVPEKFFILLLPIAFLEIVQYLERRRQEVGDGLRHLSWFARWSVYYGAALGILAFGYFGEQPFIYFQF